MADDLKYFAAIILVLFRVWDYERLRQWET